MVLEAQTWGFCWRLSLSLRGESCPYMLGSEMAGFGLPLLSWAKLLAMSLSPLISLSHCRKVDNGKPSAEVRIENSEMLFTFQIHEGFLLGLLGTWSPSFQLHVWRTCYVDHGLPCNTWMSKTQLLPCKDMQSRKGRDKHGNTCGVRRVTCMTGKGRRGRCGCS